MKVRVVGVQKQEYKLDNGYEFKGRKLHCIDLDSNRSDLDGCLVMNVKIANESPLSSVPISVGSEYVCYFNQKGALDYIAPAGK